MKAIDEELQRVETTDIDRTFPRGPLIDDVQQRVTDLKALADNPWGNWIALSLSRCHHLKISWHPVEGQPDFE